MTQDCAFDVRHLGLGRAPAAPPRDRAFAMPITGLGLALRMPAAGVGEINMPQQGVGREPTGLGAFNVAGAVTTCPAGSNWVPVSPTSSFAVSGGKATFAQVVGWCHTYMSSGSPLQSDGRFYFDLGGVPLRYNPSTGAISKCIVVAASQPATPSGVQLPVAMVFPATGAPNVRSAILSAAFLAMGLPSTAPTPGQAVFQTSPGQGQFCWVYNSTGVTRPSTPPPGVTLPGAWAMVRPHYWVWYPMPSGALTVVNTFFTVADAQRALGGPQAKWLTKPTAPPPQVAGTAAGTGQWLNSNPGYWVWVPSTLGVAVAPVATSYTWLWVLLGLGAVGGVGYYLLD